METEWDGKDERDEQWSLRWASTVVMLWSVGGALAVYLISRPVLDALVLEFGGILSWSLVTLVMPLLPAAFIGYTVWWFAHDIERGQWLLTRDQCRRLLRFTDRSVRWLLAVLAIVTLFAWLVGD